MLGNRIIGEGTENPRDILANPMNFRRHPKEQLTALEGALEEIGWIQRVIINKRTGHLIDGHARVELAIRRKESEVPVIYVDLDEREERIALASLDPIAALANNDDGMLSKLLDGIEAHNDALAEFLDSLTDDKPEIIDGNTDPDSVPEAEEVPVSQHGDIWVLGSHRLMCGDSTSVDDVDKLMDGGLADLCFTSPPYGVGLEYGEYVDTFDNCKQLLRDIAPVIFHALRPGGFCVTNFGDIISAREINGTDVPSEYPMALEYWPAFTAAGFALHSRRIWAKPHARVAAPWCASSNRAASDWEHIWTWLKPGAQYLNERRQFSALGVWDTSKMEGVDVGKDRHPAAFPVSIACIVIETYSDTGNIVFEPFSGTGTTIIACEKEARVARAVELDPRYMDIAIRRWQEFTGKRAVLEATGQTFDEVATTRVNI